jgi:hypothetical protein
MSYLDNFILKTGLSSWNLVFNWIRSTVISLVIRRNTLSKPFFNSHENFFCNKFLGLVENFLVNSSCRIGKIWSWTLDETLSWRYLWIGKSQVWDFNKNFLNFLQEAILKYINITLFFFFFSPP